jgi:hypothetical protein
MACAIGLREHQPIVPNATPNTGELVRELIVLEKELDVRNLLSGWAASLQILPSKNATEAFAFLLKLDTNNYTINSFGYKKDEMEKASQDYLKLEKELEATVGVQAVLVSVGRIEQLRVAYPSYYSDTRGFIREIVRAIGTEQL